MAEQILCPACKSYYTLMTACTLCGGTGFVSDASEPTVNSLDVEGTNTPTPEAPTKKTKQTSISSKAFERSTEI